MDELERMEDELERTEQGEAVEERGKEQGERGSWAIGGVASTGSTWASRQGIAGVRRARQSSACTGSKPSTPTMGHTTVHYSRTRLRATASSAIAVRKSLRERASAADAPVRSEDVPT